MNSLPIARLMKFLRLPNMIDTTVDFNDVIEKAIYKNTEGDPNGTYIERMWHEVQANEANPRSSFHGKLGRVNIFAQMIDLFEAGEFKRRKKTVLVLKLDLCTKDNMNFSI